MIASCLPKEASCRRKGLKKEDGSSTWWATLLQNWKGLYSPSALFSFGESSSRHTFSQLYSPPEDYERKLSFFPGIADAISRSGNLSAQEREAAIRHEVWKVSRAIQRAARVLRGEFSRQNEQSNFTSMVTPWGVLVNKMVGLTRVFSWWKVWVLVR